MNKIKIPDDFDWKVYLKLNKDIKHKKEKEAIEHYLNYGMYENRLYKIDDLLIPSDFKWELYIKLNDDLKYIDNEADALQHYLRYGIKEDRIYKKKIIEFNILEKHYDFINESEINYTKLYFKENTNFLNRTIDKNVLYSLNNLILIIDFNNGGGGTTFFLNSIVSKYNKYTTFVIIRYDGQKYTLNINEEYLIKYELNNTCDIIKIIEKIKTKITSVFVNSFIGHCKEFIDYIMNLNICKIGITHDYFNIFDIPQPLFKNIETSKLNKLVDINKYDKLITQNIENINIFGKYYKKHIDIVELPDFFKSDEYIENINKTINCCIIGNINKLKGAYKLIKIINYFNIINKNINFFILGHIDSKILDKIKNKNKIKIKFYNSINEFNELLKEFKPNILLELSVWPETYCYTLTLSMLTDLPILYLTKRKKSVIQNRLIDYMKSYKFSSLFELSNLIDKHKQNYFYTIKPVLSYNKFWNDLFIGNKIEKYTFNMSSNFKYGVKPYFIYFPQFHEIYENNINFYDKYTDINNLILFNKEEIHKKEIPDSSYCDINNYDYIKNIDFLQKQIDLISYYGFCGFALYYYWFSKNTFTNKNMIMDNVIDKFFSSSLNMNERKVFFIWANENWTDNVALSPNNSNIIENMYNSEEYEKNSNNLIEYFIHDNYLKIDNKPVFLIYHNYLINNIDLFYDILQRKCIENKFDGVYLVVNSYDTLDSKFKNCYINFNYKKYASRFFDKNINQIKLDYVKYMNDKYHFKNNTINTITYDFDNRVRLYKPNNLLKSTVCINNTEMHKIIFTNKILETYNDETYGELDKILLVNAFNEWGENMVFEPSNRYGYYNINLLKKNLSTKCH